MVKRLLRTVFPNQYNALRYWLKYRQATRLLGNHISERELLFDAMVQRSEGRPAMQVGVRGQKYAPHWVSVDLYDPSPLIDYHYDIMDLPFEDHYFEFIACKAVLEHIPYPQRAIAEMHRVLKPNGEIWIEVPFNQPYHEAPKDYWRVSPDGMRIWMDQFEERAIGLFSPYHSIIYNGIFYHGVKVG